MLTVPEYIKGLIFDCDGTLADTMPIHNRAWHATLSKHDMKFEQDFFDDVAGMPTASIVEIYNKTFNKNLDVESFSKLRDESARRELINVSPIDPVVSLVKKYHRKLPMSVASGGGRSSVLATLKAIGLENYFDTIITADDDVEHKPSPKIFLYAAECMDVEPEYCQVFEDAEAGLTGARKAGMLATDVRPWIK